MTKKRRMFDITLPEGDLSKDGLPVAGLPADAMPELETKSAAGPTAGPAAPSTGSQRRGPMATAIGENADALKRRHEQEVAIRVENDDLAHEFIRLKKLGLVTDLIPLEAIRTTKLVRDRARHIDPELGDLKTSIKAVGLSNPIQVEPLGEGAYELVQGWRRLSAYRELLAETGDARYARIPAGLLAKGETIDGLYRRMVDENMVRKDISWAEMARLALNYAADPAVESGDVDDAVNVLFASAAPQKRSYIRRFALLLRMMEKVLEHPQAIPRALGLEVAHRLEAEPGSSSRLGAALRAQPNRSAEAELDILRAFCGESPALSPRGKPGRGRPPKRGKTTLRIGAVTCTASPGKVELQVDRDFSALSADRLERAVQAFFSALG